MASFMALKVTLQWFNACRNSASTCFCAAMSRTVESIKDEPCKKNFTVLISTGILRPSLVTCSAFPGNSSVALHPGHRSWDRGDAFRRINVQRSHPQQLFTGITKPLAGDVVDFYENAGQAVVANSVKEDGVANAVEELPIAIFAIVQQFLGAPAIGDVLDNHQISADVFLSRRRQRGE